MRSAGSGRWRVHTRLRHVAAGATAAAALLTAGCSSSDPDDPAAFCDSMRTASAPAGFIATVDIDDATSLDAAVAELDNLASLAPRDIADEMATVAQVYEEVLTSLAATAPGARPDVLRDLQERLDEAAAPAEAVERYGQSVCGVRFSPPAQPTPTPAPLDLDD